MKIAGEIKELVKKVKVAPNRETANSYFDLVKRVLEIAKLRNDDPRLMMSSVSSKEYLYFPTTINNRYVIFSNFEIIQNKQCLSVGFIFPSYWRDIPDLRKNRQFTQLWQFDNLTGEKTEPPVFLRFDYLSDALEFLKSSKQARLLWQEAINAEVGRRRSSVYRRHHEPLVYKLVTDKKFRTKILDLAFNTANEAGADGGGYGDSVTNKKVENAAIKFVKKDYQRRGWSVRSVESEHRGYDLICTKGKLEEYVEVKGIQGDYPSFLITSNEVQRSRKEKIFKLCVVTSALSNPNPIWLTGAEFNKQYMLEAASYRAYPK